MAISIIAGARCAGKGVLMRLTPRPTPVVRLPASSIDVAAIMREAHRLARAMAARIPYAARLRLALRRSWAAARLLAMAAFREAIADRVERLIAVLDVIDGDADFEDAGDFEPNDAGLGDWDGLYEQGHGAGAGLRGGRLNFEPFNCNGLAGHSKSGSSIFSDLAGVCISRLPVAS